MVLFTTRKNRKWAREISFNPALAWIAPADKFDSVSCDRQPLVQLRDWVLQGPTPPILPGDEAGDGAPKKVEARMLQAPGRQNSLIVPGARSINHRGSGLVGYNVQTAVETDQHLIVAHEVTNVGSDRRQ